MDPSTILVVFARLAMGVMALFSLRDAWRLMQGKPGLVQARGRPIVVSGWGARLLGALLLVLGLGLTAFALAWRGPHEAPHLGG